LSLSVLTVDATSTLIIPIVFDSQEILELSANKLSEAHESEAELTIDAQEILAETTIQVFEEAVKVQVVAIVVLIVVVTELTSTVVN